LRRFNRLCIGNAQRRKNAVGEKKCHRSIGLSAREQTDTNFVKGISRQRVPLTGAEKAKKKSKKNKKNKRDNLTQIIKQASIRRKEMPRSFMLPGGQFATGIPQKYEGTGG